MTAKHEQRIEQWSILGRRSLKGNVYHRPGRADGAGVVTSGVVEIRMVDEDSGGQPYAIAITESGSVYRLGRPADGPGAEAAQLFIAAFMRRGSPRSERRRSSLAAHAASESPYDSTPGMSTAEAESYATCFRPL